MHPGFTFVAQAAPSALNPGPLERPMKTTLVITEQCNLDCRLCYGRCKEPKPRPQKPSGSPPPLELLEREIEEQEALIARLEGKLAEDWADAEAVAAHRAAREELQSLLARWEQMLDEVAG